MFCPSGRFPLTVIQHTVRCLLALPQVTPVSYVRFSTSPVLSTHSRESLRALPLGVVLTFAVHFHASTGEVLHSSNSLLAFSTNRSVGETLFGREKSRQGR